MSSTRRRTVTALIVWFLTRAVLYVTATGHFLRSWGKPSVGDIALYMNWAHKSLQYGNIPVDTKWQYPPLLAPILEIPQWIENAVGLRYQSGFTVMTFTADAVITVLLLWTAAHRDVWSGPWYWIAGVPLLGPIVYGRYDLFPALFVVFALVLLGKGVPHALAEGADDGHQRRKRWLAGALIGLGAAVKIWPGLAVFGLPRTKRGRETIIAAIAAIVASTALLSLFYTHTMSFVGNEGGRGIEIESVWGVLLLAGKRAGLWHVNSRVLYGSYQAVPSAQGYVVTIVNVAYYVSLAATVIGFALMAYWWWRKTWRPAVVADATFVATLLMIVTSRVISPQYMIWVLAVAGFCLLYKDTTQRRSALLVLIALPLTQYEFPFGFQSLIRAHVFAVLAVIARDALLVAATYIGYRDLWASTVEGAFLPRRLRAVFGRGGARGGSAAEEPAAAALGIQRPAPASESEAEPAQA
ncbi:glycosyltransferase family 87 protein [Actinospica robiniae]|uniref:glycosyltransferase family 87 protein n=1 Tax=Actinospica robiniae TaxID=304901 RepID=UPI000551D585|nr:glycosyltransferase family 87 protein [Actinospica robiniae]